MSEELQFKIFMLVVFLIPLSGMVLTLFPWTWKRVAETVEREEKGEPAKFWDWFFHGPLP